VCSFFLCGGGFTVVSGISFVGRTNRRHEGTILWSFIACNLHQIILCWWNGGCDRRVVWHAPKRREINRDFYSENPNMFCVDVTCSPLAENGNAFRFISSRLYPSRQVEGSLRCGPGADMTCFQLTCLVEHSKWGYWVECVWLGYADNLHLVTVVLGSGLRRCSACVCMCPE